MVKINASFFVSTFMVLGLYVNFCLDNSKAFVFVDAYSIRVYEDTIDVLLYFMEITCYYY